MMKLLAGPLFILILLFSCGITSCAPETEWPEGLPHGEIILTNIDDPDSPGAYFDFSAGELVYGDEGRARGDIYLERNFIAGNPALDVKLAEKQPDSILYDLGAPSWGSGLWKERPDENTPPRVAVRQGYNVWVRTGEGNIGKLKILLREANDDYTSMLNIKIQWIYQPDPNSDMLESTAFTSGTPSGSNPE